MTASEHKTTKKGYMRFRTDGERLRMEHCLVWERHFGKIPEGMQIHHIDGDKTNNDITNLQLVTPLEHRRIHEGCKCVNGKWYKPCKGCGEYKEMTKENWYFSRGYINGTLCKKCYIAKTCEARKERVAHGWKRKEYRKEDA